MFKRKTFLKSIAVFLTLLMLSGCTGNGEEIETEASTTQTEVTETESTTSEPPVENDSGLVGELVSIYPYAEVNSDYKQIGVDGKTMNKNTNSQYRGLGAVISDNSSKLLMDYKEDDYNAYCEMLEYLFKPDTGAGLSHITIDIGTRVSYGTNSDGQANVYKDAGFMIAADAKNINPDITIEIRESGINSNNYDWHRSIIESAFNEYNLEINYISVDFGDTNDTVLEQDIDISKGIEQVIYFASSLRAENNTPYDYSKIKIVVADNNGSAILAEKMLENAEFRNSVDIIGVKGTSNVNEAILELNSKYEKEIWYKDGETSNTSRLFSGATIANNGLGNVSNSLNVCNRIINNYYSGKMTMYEYSSAIFADYNGKNSFAIGDFPNALVTAQTPWNGLYRLNSGIWTSIHFTGFIEKGWQFVDSACMGSEDNDNFMTVADPDTGDFSIVICNDSDESVGYTFTVTNLERADKLLRVWETAGPQDENEEFNYNYMQLTDEFFAVEQESDESNSEVEIDENGLVINSGDNLDLPPYSFSVTLKPNSIMTVTTLDKYGMITDIRDYYDSNYEYTTDEDENFTETLSLPWSDDYEYSEDFLSLRGNAPKYTTDLCGFFDVVVMLDEDENENYVLMQMSTSSNETSINSQTNPFTCFGDDRWSNYAVETDFLFDVLGNSQNYVQLGLRCSGIDSGYALRIFQDGSWQLRKNADVLESGRIDSFNASEWHIVRLEANQNMITAYLDEIELIEFTDEKSIINSGRVSLSGNYFKNSFDNVNVEEISGINPYVVRIDDHSPLITYTDNWNWNVLSVNDENSATRTITETSIAGEEFDLWVYGTDISLIGAADNAVLRIWLDGEEFEVNVDSADYNSVLYKLSDIEEGSHFITVTLVSGSIALNMIEYS